MQCCSLKGCMQVCRIQFGGGVSQEQDSADKPVWCHCTSDERSLWSGHTSRSVYNIHVGVGGPGGDSESPYGYNLCVASYFYANFEYSGAHLAKWLNIVSNVKALVGEGAFSMIVKSSQRFV